MQHQLIVLRGPQPTYHTSLMLSVDGWRSVAQSLDRESLITTVAGSIDEDGRAFQTMNVLSIDAWRERSGGWTWDHWHKRGTLTVREFGRLGCRTRQETRVTLTWLREQGYLSEDSKGAVTIEDDQYNLTVLDRKPRKPLIAIEYVPLFS